MAGPDKKISQLPQASSMGGSDLIVIVQPASAGTTKKLSLDALISSIANEDKTITAGGITPAVGLRFGGTLTEGLEVRIFDETYTIAASADNFDLTSDIPSGAVILGAQLNIATAVVGAGTPAATAVGLGVDGDPNKYGETTGFTKNLKSDAMAAWAVLSATENVKLFATDGSGTKQGTLESGVVRVRIYFIALNGLDDVA